MYKTQEKNFRLLEISLASPRQIRSWCERFLENGDTVGEVTSWETVNYKTLKPEPNGLFCQRIFGPIVDYTCACGKKTIKLNNGVCPKCGVERTSSQVRRYRLGYISLKQPVVHTLYATQKPSPVSVCLNWPNKKVQAVSYGIDFCHLSHKFKYFPRSRLLWKPAKRFSRAFKYKTTSFKRRLSTPRLYKKPDVLTHSFRKKWKFLLFLFCDTKLYFSTHLYGISYDSSWRQVEDFQGFLLYMWQHPGFFDVAVPYYFWKKRVPDYALTKGTLYPEHMGPKHVQYYPIQTGGFVLKKILSSYKLIGFLRQITVDLYYVRVSLLCLQRGIRGLSGKDREAFKNDIIRRKEVRKKWFRRFLYFRDFIKSELQPAWMVLSYLPVLPPDLRPITSIRGELVVSDLNSLYRKVLTRNRRLTNSITFNIFDTALSGSWASWCYNLRQVQESVDSLLKTGKVESGKTTKSLLDSLKGKRGRFRQHLLGKRVDYSGRSVIIVGPKLRLYECGLPKQMAVELFQPFLIQQLRNKRIAYTTTGAKAIISERKPIIWTLLREILQSHPVLLNRAPTLHRLGIQSFIPKLVEGKAILLHPLVCPAFNADFDGDQMAVHIPLSHAARAEAFNLLLACNNILAPSLGQPLLLPTQDMILGCYYLTINSPKKRSSTKTYLISSNSTKVSSFVDRTYSSFDQILEDYSRQKLTLHTMVWVLWDGIVQNLTSKHYAHDRNKPCELRFDFLGRKESFYSEKYIYQYKDCRDFSNSKTNALEKHFYRTTVGRIILYKLMNTI